MERTMPFTLVYGDHLADFPGLADEMFCDRREQFMDTLGWELDVDHSGRETDDYDLLNPLYVILRDDAGAHLGSTRLMPTTGPTMIADHFSHITGGVEIESPLIWEVTRFFIADNGASRRKAASALMWAGCRFGLDRGVNFYVGVTATAMVNVFAAAGWPAEIIGEGTCPEGDISACLWELTEEKCADLATRAGLSQDDLHLSVHRRLPKAANLSHAPKLPMIEEAAALHRTAA